ncbi:MAG TPA: Mur ligase family protein [Candidatus Melainabacteria bacterium]|nr:Mur ligase family protein [Candidatus Melainabacteria bacterium]
MNYKESVDWLLEIPNLDQPVKGVCNRNVMTPERMRKFLERTGFSTATGAKTIHVTGTKGKGSTTTMLASVLNKFEGPSALFISPHLKSFTERITLNGQSITEAVFAREATRIKEAVDKAGSFGEGEFSQFYVLISLFLNLVKEADPHIRWQILEVGLGGRFDPTNIFDHKELAVFVPVHKDHCAFLGDTIEEIAREKAEIIKEGCHVIIAEQPYPEAYAVISEKAKDMGCEFTYVPDHYRVESMTVEGDRQSFSLAGPRGVERYRTRMLGHHQLINSATVLASVQQICRADKELQWDQNKINDGLVLASLPGRMEVLSESPLIIADGAHTRESAEIALRFVKDHYVFKRLILVLAISNDKDKIAIIDAVAKDADLVIATAIDKSRATPADELADLVKMRIYGEVETISTIEQALERAQESAGEEDLILITGSLYLAAEACSLLKKITRKN